MKTQKTIPVLIFRDSNSGEADEVFRLDKKEHAENFWWTLKENTERGDIHHICVEEWTKDQWRLSELYGLAFTGEISNRQEKQLDKLKKTVGPSSEIKWPS